MNTLIKILIGLTTLTILVLGIGFGIYQEQSDSRPAWVHEVNWQGMPNDARAIEELLWNEISPYSTDYETVNITSGKEGNGLRLKVIASTKDSEGLDIYDFTYEGGELLMTGYLLEAVPQSNRDEAIGIALSNREVAESTIASGIPTVRRILPKTAEKYYTPKTLLSVTWKGISALVDPDERKVVQVWKESGNAK